MEGMMHAKQKKRMLTVEIAQWIYKFILHLYCFYTKADEF